MHDVPHMRLVRLPLSQLHNDLGDAQRFNVPRRAQALEYGKGTDSRKHARGIFNLTLLQLRQPITEAKRQALAFSYPHFEGVFSCYAKRPFGYIDADRSRNNAAA